MKCQRFFIYFETYFTPIIQFVKNISSVLQTWQNDRIWTLLVFWFRQKSVMNAIDSRFWVPGCDPCPDPCLPAVRDHLFWTTIFAWPSGWSLYAGFTVLAAAELRSPGRRAGTFIMHLQWQHYVKPYRTQSWKWQPCAGSCNVRSQNESF